MAKRPLPQSSIAEEHSSLLPDKMLVVPEGMPERLKDIVNKKQSLLEQIWKDQRSMIQMRWYVAKCAELNNRVKEDLKSFKEQIAQHQQQQMNGGPAKRQQLMGQRMPDDTLGHTAMSPAMQAPSAYGAQLNAGPNIAAKRLSNMSGYERGGGGWNDPNML